MDGESSEAGVGNVECIEKAPVRENWLRFGPHVPADKGRTILYMCRNQIHLRSCLLRRWAQSEMPNAEKHQSTGLREKMTL